MSWKLLPTYLPTYLPNNNNDSKMQLYNLKKLTQTIPDPS